MNYEELARTFDQQDKPLEAAWAYELAIANTTNPDVFINLVVLYFMACDPGYAAVHHLDPLFVDVSYDRAVEVLKSGEARLGRNAELEFWSLFMRDRVLGEQVSRERYLRLAFDGGTSLPYLALFAASDGKEFKREVYELFSGTRLGRTARERYIRSLARIEETRG